MDIASTVPLVATPLNALFATEPADPRAGELAWLARCREAARTSFFERGLPTKMDESWRYTDLKRLRDGQFRPVTEAEIGQAVPLPATLVPGGTPFVRVVFVNGAFRADLSEMNPVPGGITVTSIAAAMGHVGLSEVVERSLKATAALEAAPMVALNTALFEDGLLLVAEPRLPNTIWIEAVFVNGGDVPVAFTPRHCVEIGAETRLVLIEQHIGIASAPYLANPVLQVDLQRGATLRHYRTVECGPAASNVVTSVVNVASDARYENVTLTGGRGLNRIETQVTLGGSGASCTVGGAYHAGGEDLCDNTTLVEHAAPKTSSRQVFRGVIEDRARAVFQGRVLVAAGADEADGHQLSKALLLSDEAEIDQKPALEIFADNVKCSHGAVAGALDKGALFYLRSRGLPEAIARRLLIEGFLAEALQEVSIEGVRVALQERAAAMQTTRQSQP
jgi:FeS assembly protein SufD